MAQQNDENNNISLQQEKKEKQRGVAKVANPLQQDALNLQSAQMSAKNASIEQQTQAFGGKSSEIVTLISDEAGLKSKGSKTQNQSVITVEVVPDQSGAQSYNEISSFSVDKLNCAETVSKLSTILSSYSNEIDFSVDMDKNTIENGCVFMNNYFSVYFMIYVETDENTKKTRFEFRRQSGDGLASAKFLGDVKSLFFGGDDKENSLIALDLKADDLEMKVNKDQQEKMMIHEALISDDFVGDDLDENAENYLYGQLVKNKAVNKLGDTVDHKILCKTLIEKETLLHEDIAVVRASLLILNKMANDKEDYGLADNAALFALLSQIMTKQRGLVQQYALKLLSDMAQSEKEWKMNDKDKATLSKSLKDYETRFSNKKYYDQKVVDAVSKKL